MQNANKSITAEVVDTDKYASGHALNSDGGLVTWGRVRPERKSERVFDFKVVLPYHATAQSDTFHMAAYASGARVLIAKFVRPLMPTHTNEEITVELSKVISGGKLDNLVPDGKRTIDPTAKKERVVKNMTAQEIAAAMTPEQLAEFLAMHRG